MFFIFRLVFRTIGLHKVGGGGWIEEDCFKSEMVFLYMDKGKRLACMFHVIWTNDKLKDVDVF